MKRNRQGFTLIEMIIVVVVIGIIATVTTVTYGTIVHRAKNTAALDSVAKYVKLLQTYRTKHGTWPLQQYTNSPYRGSVNDASPDLDGKTGEKYATTLILNHPSVIKQLKHAELASRVQQTSDNPSFHGVWPVSGFSYRAGFIDYGPVVNAASISYIRQARDWDYYADYLAQLFKDFDLPAVYSDSGALAVKHKHAHGGKERVVMGLTYYLIHRPHGNETSAFLSYALRGDTDCGNTTVRRTYVRQDNITACSIQLPN